MVEGEGDRTRGPRLGHQGETVGIDSFGSGEGSDQRGPSSAVGGQGASWLGGMLFQALSRNVEGNAKYSRN